MCPATVTRLSYLTPHGDDGSCCPFEGGARAEKLVKESGRERESTNSLRRVRVVVACTGQRLGGAEPAQVASVQQAAKCGSLLWMPEPARKGGTSAAQKKHPWHKSLSGKRSPSQEVLSDTGLCQLIEPQIGVTYEDKKLYAKKVKGSVHCHHEVDVK